MFARGKLDSKTNMCHSVYYCLARDRISIFIPVGGSLIIRICLRSMVVHNGDFVLLYRYDSSVKAVSVFRGATQHETLSIRLVL